MSLPLIKKGYRAVLGELLGIKDTGSNGRDTRGGATMILRRMRLPYRMKGWRATGRMMKGALSLFFLADFDIVIQGSVGACRN